jgi:hypothetical protein
MQRLLWPPIANPDTRPCYVDAPKSVPGCVLATRKGSGLAGMGYICLIGTICPLELPLTPLAVSRFSTGLILLLAFAASPKPSLAQAVAAPGQAAWKEDFEGPTNSWVDAGGDAAYTVVAHQRVHGGAHGGQGSEWIQIAAGTAARAPGGNRVFFAHDIGRPSVIEELRPTLWVFSDRVGLQLLAEVTLPRTRDPRTGKPLTTTIAGSTYTLSGSSLPSTSSPARCSTRSSFCGTSCR